ncbi:hypothetical protein tb265_40210 [Gemmatimonadetes bacterium T265]|nr:hypothetical protein tb265_40210 [Gemmatimonadetes bacterium T265]
MLSNLLAPEHLLVTLAVVVLLLGGKKIPELAGGLGKGLHEFRRGVHGDAPGDGGPAAPALADWEPRRVVG